MKHLRISIRLIAVAFLLFNGCSSDKPSTPPEGTLIKGATLINPGLPTEIIEQAYLYFIDNEIVSYGKLDQTKELPEAAKVIEASGKYIMPGLVEGFGTLNNQAYANAYLYKGITTLLEVDGYRRGSYYPAANPSPDIYRLESVGEEPVNSKVLIARVDSLYNANYKVVLMMYSLTPEQARLVYNHAKSLGMATIGELGLTSYQEGMGIGIDAFVHTTRYSLDVAPKDMATAVAHAPFSNDLQSPKWTYYKYLTQLKPDDPALLEHAQTLAASNSFIMPTMSLSYLDLPDSRNPWDNPVAAILNPEDINRPADPITGKHSIGQEEQEAYSNLIANETTVIEPAYYQAGAKYLSGSANDVWGTMPGISLHTELELLHSKAGLSIEETLAATTINFNKAFSWQVGQLKPGFEADILILNDNPLENLNNLNSIDKLFNNGVEINHKDLLINYQNHEK